MKWDDLSISEKTWDTGWGIRVSEAELGRTDDRKPEILDLVWGQWTDTAVSYSEEWRDLVGGSESEARNRRGGDLRLEATREDVRGHFEAWSPVCPLLTWYVTLDLSLHLWPSDDLKALVFLAETLAPSTFHLLFPSWRCSQDRTLIPLAGIFPGWQFSAVSQTKYILCQRPLERMKGKHGPRYPNQKGGPECCFLVVMPQLELVYFGSRFG